MNTLRTGKEGRIALSVPDALGKLPPQAIEMEEAVVGAIIIERSAIDKVISFLLPSHFFSQKNLLIYQAAITLYASSTPIDMRTIIHQLRATGSIDTIGGASYIAELTSKISSSANIEHHARVIIEMSMKRELIQLASIVHQTAYEDTNDVFDLLANLQTKLNDIETRNTGGGNNIELIWDEVIVKERPPTRIPVITLQNISICNLGNHSLIQGKKKSRKSLFLVFLICLALSQGTKPEEILHFDTEQEREDVWDMREKVFKVSKHHITSFNLRGKSFQERKSIIDKTIKNWHCKPKLVIIDGIRDLMSNINDPDEATELVTWIEKITTDNHLHIINVLHLNKTNNDARGHIGTELQNKSEINIELVYDDKTTYTEVRCESSRRNSFNTFMFTHSVDSLPEVVGEKIGEDTIKERSARENLLLIFEDGPLKFSVLIEEIKTYFKVGTSKAKSLVVNFRKKGWIMRNGNSRSPDAIWKIMITTAEEDEVVEVKNNSNDFQESIPFPDEEPMWVSSGSNNTNNDLEI